MKRFATSVTALAVAGAMSLSVLPAAQAQAGSSFSYTIEGIAGSVQQFAKLSPELQAEIRAAIDAQDLLKLVQLKLRADAELASLQAAANGATGAAATVKPADTSSPAGAAALSSVLTNGAGNNNASATASATASASASATTTPAPAPAANAATGSSTGGANTAANAAASAAANAATGSSSNGTNTGANGTANTGSSSNLLGNMDARTILGLTGVTMAVLSFGGLLSSGDHGSSANGNTGSSGNGKQEEKKQETKKSDGRGEGAAQGKKDQKQGDVAGKSKRGVLAATGDNTAARALAGILLALIVGGAFAARRKFVK